jgi:hypothetical protein
MRLFSRKSSIAGAITIAAGLILAAGAASPATADDPKTSSTSSTASFGTPPAGYENAAPGTILASRSITLSALSVDGVLASAWQLLYRTTDENGNPTYSITTVVLPSGQVHSGLISVEFAEDASNANCAPSVGLNSASDITLQAPSTPFAIAAIAAGYVLSIPDYEGPQSEFGAPQQPGYMILDGIRAAESFAPLGLGGASTPVAIEGYSGGSLATGWAAQVQPTYAPELNIRGAALGGFVTDLSAALVQINGGIGAGLVVSGLPGMFDASPALKSSLGSYLTPAGDALLSEGAQNCATEDIALHPFLNISTDMTEPLGAAVATPSVSAAFRPFALGANAPQIPLFVYHAVHDEEIPIAGAAATVAAYCAAGTPVTFIQDSLSEHATLEYLGAPAALGWVESRLVGGPAPAGCTTTTVASIALMGPIH